MSNVEIVNARYGRMMVHKLDKYVGRSFLEYGEFSEGEVELFRQIITKESIVVDVGANIGAHTVVFGNLAKEVYAFEPQQHIYKLLCGNVALNELYNVHCYPYAVGDGREVPYRDIDMGQPNNMGAGALMDLTGDTRFIPTVPLNIPCHFLKVDVEGMELVVLHGAEKMIRECQPALYVENDRPDKSAALIRYINSLGYKCYWHGTALFNKNNFNQNPNDVWGAGIGSINMLCIPKEAAIQGLEEADPNVHWNSLWNTHPDDQVEAIST